MRWNVNRKNVDGKHLCYWLRKAKVIIVDYGHENGDIHIYKHLESVHSEKLKDVLDKYAENDDIASSAYLEIKELKDDNSLFRKIFTYQSKQNNNNFQKDRKNDKTKTVR